MTLPKNIVLPILRPLRRDLVALYRKVDGDFYNPHHLQLWCGISSVAVFSILHKRKCEVQFCQNDHHAFVRQDDNVIDLTLPQFNSDFPKIFVSKQIIWPHHDFDETAKDEPQIKHLLRHWEAEQNPYRFRGAQELKEIIKKYE